LAFLPFAALKAGPAEFRAIFTRLLRPFAVGPPALPWPRLIPRRTLVGVAAALAVGAATPKGRAFGEALALLPLAVLKAGPAEFRAIFTRLLRPFAGGPPALPWPRLFPRRTLVGVAAALAVGGAATPKGRTLGEALALLALAVLKAGPAELRAIFTRLLRPFAVGPPPTSTLRLVIASAPGLFITALDAAIKILARAVTVGSRILPLLALVPAAERAGILPVAMAPPVVVAPTLETLAARRLILTDPASPGAVAGCPTSAAAPRGVVFFVGWHENLSCYV